MRHQMPNSSGKLRPDQNAVDNRHNAVLDQQILNG